ncbi:HVO_A0114 family putative DNA-binding protein [Rhodopila globiformis]|uniref:DNA-binding protein n=1 Tax=Rhodopila globiformis TaxID=1071 RepID=A0A2S6N9N3_RHOGL|nr:DNA-binding protein [Rhodopila globiformis]PPQ31328.1 DNA-binding protein [Rhodopila globiformis]
MTVVTLDVRSLEDTLADVAQVCQTAQPDTGPRISFATPALLWQVLTARRWDLLKALTGQPPMSLRQAARRAGRDVKAVHGDVHALLKAGVLTKTAEGKIAFPYDGIHVDFTLHAA